MTSKAYLKHCIILSDGDPSPPVPSLVAKFNAAKITVSTIVIGPHDPSGVQNMFNIAKEHGGRFYKVNKPQEIPNIFLKEAATVSRSAIIEETFVPRVGTDSTILKGIGSLPPLLGYVGTSAKTTAKEVLKSKQDDPILATWQYGLGKSVAFTSDARKRWAAGWLGWSGYSKFWAQSVRWSMRGTTAGDLQTNVTIDKGVGKVTIEAVDSQGNFLNFLNPKARLITPDYKGSDLTLDQIGPGRYQAQFDARQLGTYLVNIRTQKGDETRSQITGGVLPYSPEYGAVGTDEFLLNGLRERAGGDRLPLDKPAEVFGRPRPPASLPIDIWLPLLMAAAVLFPLDVAVRRLVVGEDELNSLSARLKRKRGDKSSGDASVAAQLKVKRAARNAQTPAAKTVVAPRQSQSGSAPTAPAAPTPTQRPAAPRSSAPDAQPDEPAPSPENAEPEELDAMERLRRAKRRARGEE